MEYILQTAALVLAYLVLALHNVIVTSQGGSAPVDPSPTPQTSILELDVLGFRVWMIIGFVGIGFLIIIVVLCCIFDCRIPRTKQQIEQDQERRDLIAKYKEKVKAMQYKKSKYMQARQRTAMLIGDWGFEGGTDGGTGVAAGSDHAPGASGAGDPIPLAQHPAAMLTGTKEGGSNPSNKPLGAMSSRTGNPATARALASLDPPASDTQNGEASTGL